MKKEKHYVRKATKKEMKKKENFFILWKLVRLRNIIERLSFTFTNRLNNCGWLFKRDDHNHQVFRCYQRKEEYLRLLHWIREDIRKTDRKDSLLSKDQRHYILNILVDLHLLIDDCRRFSNLSAEEKDMLTSMSSCYIKKLINIL